MERHHRARLPFAILGVVVLAACESPTGPPEPLAVVRITSGYFSAIETPQRLVIRSQAELAAAFDAMFRTLSHPPELPSVDFSREMVIIALAGSKPTSAYCITVDAAAGNRRSMTVTVRTAGPPPGMGLLPVVTNPYDIVRVPRRDEVTFSEISEVRNCGIQT